MKNLILIRHAKSDWSMHQDDFDRTLTDRGISDAALIARKAVTLLPKQFHIFSSSAARARETSIIFAKIFNYPLEKIHLNDSLYTFDAARLEQQINTLPDDYQNVILFGHNEAITNFVNKFGHIFIDNVSTSGFVWLAFESDSWQNISKGKTEKVIFPSHLKS